MRTLTKKEQKFADHVRRVVTEEHRIPGPTELNQFLKWGSRDHQLHANYSSIRREIFEELGLIKVNDRWRFPNEALARSPRADVQSTPER